MQIQEDAVWSIAPACVSVYAAMILKAGSTAPPDALYTRSISF
jgi:hypothetical protein